MKNADAVPAEIVKQIDFNWAKVLMTGNPEDPYFANIENYLHGSPGLWYFVGSHLPPDAVIIDCGANIGATTLMMATRCPAGHVYAIEASPKNAAFLRRNVELNNLQNVTVIETAVGHDARDVRFHMSNFGAGSHVIAADGGQQDSANLVLRTVTLDSIAAELPRLDFIKMDVEGCEPAALLGAEATIRRLTPRIYVEINSFSLLFAQRYDPFDFVRFLFGAFDVQASEAGELKPLTDPEGFLYENMINHQCVDDVLLTLRKDAQFGMLDAMVNWNATAMKKKLGAAEAEIAALVERINNAPLKRIARMLRLA